MMKFSPSTTYFYDPQINMGGIPADAVDITVETFTEMLEARAAGRVIEADKDGRPVARELAPPPQPTLEERKAKLMSQATARRWEVETGGIALSSGARIATGKDDQDRITSVLVNAQLAGIESIEFKAASGWLSLTLSELRAIATVIALHVQACFSAERQHHNAIAALSTLAAVQTYDLAAHWPQSSIDASLEA